jgi:hypothetical protein
VAWSGVVVSFQSRERFICSGFYYEFLSEEKEEDPSLLPFVWDAAP